jgi:hypothetical protein
MMGRSAVILGTFLLCAGLGKRGQPGKISVQAQPDQKIEQMKFNLEPSDFGLLHTHPNKTAQHPSANDQDAARQISRPVYTLTSEGRFLTQAGKTMPVFKGLGFLDKKKK